MRMADNYKTYRVPKSKSPPPPPPHRTTLSVSAGESFFIGANHSDLNNQMSAAKDLGKRNLTLEAGDATTSSFLRPNCGVSPAIRLPGHLTPQQTYVPRARSRKGTIIIIVFSVLILLVIAVTALITYVDLPLVLQSSWRPPHSHCPLNLDYAYDGSHTMQGYLLMDGIYSRNFEDRDSDEFRQLSYNTTRELDRILDSGKHLSDAVICTEIIKVSNRFSIASNFPGSGKEKNHGGPWYGLMLQFLVHVKKRQYPEYVLSDFSQQIRMAGKRINGNRVYLDAIDIQNTEELMGEFRLSDYTTVPYDEEEKLELRKKVHELLHNCVVGSDGLVRVIVDSIRDRKVHFRLLHTHKIHIKTIMDKMALTQFTNSEIVKPDSIYITDKYRIMGHIVFKNYTEESKFCLKNTESSLHSLLGLGDLSKEISLVEILCNSIVHGLVHVQLELNNYHPSELVQKAFLTALKELYSTQHRDIIIHQTVWFHDAYSVFVGIPIETFLIQEKPHIETSEVQILRKLKLVEALNNDVEDVYIYRNQQDLYFQISLRKFHSLQRIEESMHMVLNTTDYRISDYQLSSEKMEVIDVYPVLARIRFCMPLTGRTGAIETLLEQAQNYKPSQEETAVAGNIRNLFYQSSVARDFIQAYPIGRDNMAFSLAIFLRSYHSLQELFSVTRQYYTVQCTAPYQLDTSNIMLTDELNYLSAIISPAAADLQGRKQDASEENKIPEETNKLVYIEQASNITIPWLNLQPEESTDKLEKILTTIAPMLPEFEFINTTEESLSQTEVSVTESDAVEAVTVTLLKSLIPTIAPTTLVVDSLSFGQPGSSNVTEDHHDDHDVRPPIDFGDLENHNLDFETLPSSDTGEVIDLNLADHSGLEVQVIESTQNTSDIPHSISEVSGENVHEILERKVRDKSRNRGKSTVDTYPAVDNVGCREGDINCGDGMCLPSSGRCNSYMECSTGVDEKGCTCPQLLNRNKICDEIPDCIDGSDEMGCDGCGDDEFKCIHDWPLTCFTQSQRCDGIKQCTSGEDERNCLLLTEERKLTKVPLMTRTSGYLTAMVNGTWYTVCHLNLDMQALANKVCNNMITNYDAPPIGGISGRSTITVTTKVKEVLLPDVESKTDFAMKLSADQWSIGMGCPTRKALEVECSSPVCGVSDHEDQKIVQKRSTSDLMSRMKREHPDLDDGKIVGGEKAGLGEYPWICGLYRDERFVCGLSLVHKFYGITAAHCITTARNLSKKKYKKYFWSVTCGKHRRSAFSLHQQSTTVEKIFVHSKFNTYFHNDLALLKFKSPIHLNKWASQICVPSPTVQIPEYCTVLGWGVLNEGLRKHSDDLRELKIPVMEKCPQQYHQDDIMVCAAFWEEGGKDACQGDSGGPLICRMSNDDVYYQLGIVSYGRGCARKMRAGAYTRVSSYVKWMQANMQGKLKNVVDYPVSATVCPGLTCGQHDQCVLQKYICDGKVDCLSGEDEFLCIDFPEIQTFLSTPHANKVKRSIHQYNSTSVGRKACSIPREWVRSVDVENVEIWSMIWEPQYKEITFKCKEGYSTVEAVTTSCKDEAGWTAHVPTCTLINDFYVG